jgi:hypothetical protein
MDWKAFRGKGALLLVNRLSPPARCARAAEAGAMLFGLAIRLW